MAPRISLIVSSMASTARVTRSATSDRPIIGMAPCKDIPVAYSRWMTRSCRSRAIRSRSSYTDRRSASARLAASSSAMPACAANEAAKAASACGKGGSPWRRPMVNTPRAAAWRAEREHYRGPDLAHRGPGRRGSPLVGGEVGARHRLAADQHLPGQRLARRDAPGRGLPAAPSPSA